MDWGSIAGLLLALGGIAAGQAMEGGHLASLFQPAAFLIVMMGTVGAVLMQSGLPTFLRAMTMLRDVFAPAPDTHARLSHSFTLWSDVVRRDGILALDKYAETEPDTFVRMGLVSIIDSNDVTRMRAMLEQDINIYERRARAAIKVWDAAGGYAPTVGILGAVLGLIHVMENLSDPTRLGSGIAVAFVATIYGVALANLLFLPIAGKLKTALQTEVARREMLIDAIAALTTGENPKVMQARMAAWIA